jgi:hypothetical protein
MVVNAAQLEYSVAELIAVAVAYEVGHARIACRNREEDGRG